MEEKKDLVFALKAGARATTGRISMPSSGGKESITVPSVQKKYLPYGSGNNNIIIEVIQKMVTERYQVISYKTKYVNGKSAGNIPVGWSASIDNPDEYILEEDFDNFQFQITPTNSNCSTVCIVKQNESANTYIINVTTPPD